MMIYRIVLSLFIGLVLPSLISLGFGLILAKTIRFHRLGIRLIAMSVLVPGRFISIRCHQDCRFTKCGNWTCENYYHSRK